ncbi:MAG: hypothetical protein KR126chlam4_01438 [Candidatus Anoxychlamydiales bacterium]|nr:hypothetical protein [Candidatus Anoxychlamydiales bacterium]NGX41596.1 hypothetical protein [Candidatus Anoxychlamydiales bacterium]HEU64910.1 hypothetical protein [Chlamydiota bacterium]
MKINDKILNIPPYISTSWENITSLFTQNDLLVVILKNGAKIEIPNLKGDIIEEIFKIHSKVLEDKSKPKASISFGLPSLPTGGLESFTSAMQHNPEQKNAPDIPSDIINKIANIAKLFAEEANMDIPKPEDNCNCMHCQISRALQIGMGINPENLDEAVDEKDLKFRDWDIFEEGAHLYRVTNPLDEKEHYSVFLKDPIGCTCGKKNCEHIKAVLNS